jgi:Response regulator containing CheY-like receiver domain and AraC-type DNA-binding domain
MRLMIVDDEKQIRDGLSTTIEWDELGIDSVLTADNSFTAMDIIQKYVVDILVIDISMPGMNGLELASWVKKYRKESKIILLTGYPEFEYAKQAIQIGVCEYFLKPVRVNELVAFIRKLCIDVENEKKGSELIKKYIDIEKEVNSNSDTGREALFYLSGSILNNEEKSNWLAEKCKEYINENYGSDINLEDLSKAVDRNGSYISHIFKQETGKSFSEYLNEVRIRKAVQHLNSGSMLVYEIAKSVGFKDYRYFTQVFKKITGKSPSEFKNYRKI